MVGIARAEANFPRLVDRAASGDHIGITPNGKAAAKLVPFASALPQRRMGGMEGQIWMADDFDAPLPPDLLALFYGEDPR